MKALKPSHRENKRYLLISGKDCDKDKIEKVILDYIGILGWAKASPQFVKDNFNKHGGKLILAINRKDLENIRASFIISGLNIKIEKVSGIISNL